MTLAKHWDNTPYYLSVQQGKVPGASIVHKFGRNPTQANGAWEGVHQLSTTFTWLTAATGVRIKAGGSGSDTAAGVGAQAITVQGLSDVGAAVAEDIEAAGASASTGTSQTFSRVFRAYVADTRAGAYTGNNVADVVIENTAGGTDLIMIAAGEGQTQYCAYTIPLGYTGYLLSVQVQADGSKAADFRLMTRKNYLDVTTPFEAARLKFFWDGILGTSVLMPYSPILTLSALTDIWVDGRGGGAITEVSADMEILLIQD